MPSQAGQHPSPTVLRDYLHGRLPPQEAARLDNHVETCTECGKVLGEVGSDTYCDLLKKSATLVDGQTLVSDGEVPIELRSHARYEIGDRLGGGGMGVVYRAVHRMMHRPVALKLIRPELLAAPAAIERFRKEVQAAARLAHPNIVTAYDAEEVAGMHFLVMEFVEGKTLDQVVKKRGPLPSPIACHLVRQAALGLEHAHSHGMVHRDIKPQNLIVTNKSKVKILDFGLALWSPHRADGTPKNAHETSAIGTLLYAAPEQLKLKTKVDARADQYGLGATLYYLLSGRPPRSLGEGRENIEPFALTFPDSVPSGVRQIVIKLLSDDPDNRYSSAKAVAEALSPWCSNPAQKNDSTRRLAKIAIGVLSAFLALFIGVWAYSFIDRQPKRSDPPPVNPPVADTTGWQSLLAGFDPSKNKVMGNWRMDNGELAVDAFMGGRIGMPIRPSREYDLRFCFTRKNGIHSIGAIVVHNGRQVGFEVDAWEKHLAGLQDINGQPMTNNPTRRENYELVNGRRYTITIEVRKSEIICYLDGNLVTRHKTDGSDLSVNQRFWAMPNLKALGLLAWNSAAVFHSVEIRYLD